MWVIMINLIQTASIASLRNGNDLGFFGGKKVK
jgi:hypothetical protein